MQDTAAAAARCRVKAMILSRNGIRRSPFQAGPARDWRGPRQSRAILRDLLIVAAVGAAIWVAHRLGRIVLVLVLAMFFAYRDRAAGRSGCSVRSRSRGVRAVCPAASAIARRST